MNVQACTLLLIILIERVPGTPDACPHMYQISSPSQSSLKTFQNNGPVTKI